MGLYFEDWEIGKEYKSPGLTVSETHFVHWCSLTQINHPLHTDEEYCKKTPFGKRIHQGQMTISIAMGLTSRTGLRDRTAISLVGLDNQRFFRPVFIGDTIFAVDKVMEKKETRNTERGIIRFETNVFTHDGEQISTMVPIYLFKRKPKQVVK